MNLKSIKLKWIIVSAAGLLFAGVAAVVIFIAVQMGMSWPVVHRVDQGSLPDTIYVKAEDFVDDSGFVVDIHYLTCCSDKLICHAITGTQDDTVAYAISHPHTTYAIPLHWSQPSMCPRRLFSIMIRFAKPNKSDDIFYFREIGRAHV